MIRSEASGQNLDQFYTLPEIAKGCLGALRRALPTIFQPSTDYAFLEPSAGRGAFYNALPEPRLGLDIAPRTPDISLGDFLRWNPPVIWQDKPIAVVGNPPFGRRAQMALAFFARAALFPSVKVIAFIVPVQFRKHSIHRRLPPDFRLIRDQDISANAFLSCEGKPFHVNCAFQVWTRLDTKHRNLRITSSPPIQHPDFMMWQYNNTPEAEKVFQQHFDFAVPRQGYHDYTRREQHSVRCERTTQWILFRACNDTVRRRLMNMDFTALAQRNTATPGFGKADVVMAWESLSKRT